MQSDAAANQGRQIRLATEDVAPPNSIYLTQDDGLWLYASASYNAQLRVVIRLLLPDGSMSLNEWDFNVPGTRALTIFTQPLGEGFLMGLQVYDSTFSPRRGQCYASINVQRGNTANFILPLRLVQGYVTWQSRLYWPGGGWEDSFSGRGNVRSVVGTTPALGAEISESVPNLAIWRLMSIHYTFQAGPTVATRTIEFAIDDGTNILFEVGPASQQVANAAVFSTYSPGCPSFAVGTVSLGPLPTNLYMAGGSRFRTITSNLQADDQYSVLRYTVEEWLSS